MGRTIVILGALPLLLGCGGADREGPVTPSGGLAAGPARQLLEAAVAAAGGAPALRGLSSYNARDRVSYPEGQVLDMELWYRVGEARAEAAGEGGARSGLVSGFDRCAVLHGPVVVPCDAERAERMRRYHLVYEASLLLPVLEDDWEVEAGEAEVDGVRYQTVVATKAGTGVPVTLFFEPETRLLAGASVPITYQGEETVYRTVLSNRQPTCRATFPLTETGFMGDEQVITEELSDVRCIEVTDADVAVPPQVADGTVLQRQLAEAAFLCKTEGVSYETAAAAARELLAHAEAMGRMPSGPATTLLLGGPPTGAEPLAEVASVCIEVSGEAPAEPEEREGGFVLRAEPARGVLSIYGVGAYESRLGGLATQLDQAANDRGLEPGGSHRHVLYMDGETVPAAELVSELQVLLAGQ